MPEKLTPKEGVVLDAEGNALTPDPAAAYGGGDPRFGPRVRVVKLGPISAILAVIAIVALIGIALTFGLAIFLVFAAVFAVLTVVRALLALTGIGSRR